MLYINSTQLWLYKTDKDSNNVFFEHLILYTQVIMFDLGDLFFLFFSFIAFDKGRWNENCLM